jgi:thymidylate kinase
MGLDGVGKTTQINILRDYLTTNSDRSVVVIHHSTPMLSVSRHVKRILREPLIRFLKTVGIHQRFDDDSETLGRNEDKLITEKKRNIFSVFIGHWIVLNSFIKTWVRLLVYNKRWILGDRCMIDDIVRAEWRIGSGGHFGAFLLKFAPKPDKCVVLRLPIELSYRRKKAMNCAFSEYAAKKAYFDRALSIARLSGWSIIEIDVENKSAESVFHEIRQKTLQ